MDNLSAKRLIHMGKVISLQVKSIHAPRALRPRIEETIEHMKAYTTLLAEPIDPNKTRGKII